MNKLNEAIIFTVKAFEGKTRKGENVPAIFHSLEAGAIAQTLTSDEGRAVIDNCKKHLFYLLNKIDSLDF